MNPIDPKIPILTKELSEKTNAYRESILLLTANRFDLFDRIAGRSVSASEFARQMEWDLRATEIFLNALAAMGMLQKKQGSFANSEITQLLLVKASPHYQGDILNHNLNLWEQWSRVGDVLPTGRSLRDPDKKRSPKELRNFIDGMSNIARISAEKLWQEVDLSGRSKFLDAGGGPGTYALSACNHFPGLKAVVFDLPEVEPIFEEHRAKSDVPDRVSFSAGDLHSDPLPTDCDVALLSNIIHSWGEDQNRVIVNKLNEAMPSGSLLLIKDFFISEDGTEPLFSALFAVNMLLGTETGGCYTRNQVESWLKDTSFKPVDFIQLTEQAGVLVAEK